MSVTIEQKKICIFGGTGFVGEGVIPRLLEDGHEILLLTRPQEILPDDWIQNERISIVEGDAANLDSYVKVVQEFSPQVFIYLIGLIREFPKKGLTWEKLHYQAFVDALEAQKSILEKCIYMSADVAQAEGTGYETTKYRSEEYLKSSGVPYVIVRPTIIMAPSQKYHFTRVLQGLVRAPLVPVFGSGNFLLSPVAREDVAEVFAAGVGSDMLNGMICDVKGADDVSYKNLLKKVQKTFGGWGILLPLPLWFFKGFGKIFGGFSWFPFTADQVTMLSRGLVSKDMKVWKKLSRTPKGLDEILESYK